MVRGMERTWEISGLYATWRMSITVAPAEDEETLELVVWKEKDLESLVGHFQDSAQLWEMYEERERVNGQPWRQ